MAPPSPATAEMPDYDNEESTVEEMTEAERSAMLDEFSMSLARSRSANIAYRENSGIEEIWQQDTEFYEGVDDLNRFESHGSGRLLRFKPAQGGGTGMSIPRGQSRIFPNITGPFVDAAAAHVADLLIPTDGPPWSYTPTPKPDIDKLADAYSKQKIESDGEGGFIAGVKRFFASDGAEVAVADEAERFEEVTAEQAFEERKLAKEMAEIASTYVWDWQVQCGFNSELRKVIEDAAKVGVGVMKGPVSELQTRPIWDAKTGTVVLHKETVPVSKRIDYVNFYPGAGCGEDIQSSDMIWERDYVSKKELAELRLDERYLKEQINRCLRENPVRAVAAPPESVSVDTDDRTMTHYEMWHGSGLAQKEDLELLGIDLEGLQDDSPMIQVKICMVNNRCIYVALPDTDYSGHPYDLWRWRKRDGFWAGVGVARQSREGQKMVVGAMRSLMNNAGLAGGPMIVFKQGVVYPADGVAALAPRKIWYISKSDTTIEDATKAIGQVKVDIMVNEMITIVQKGIEMAENNTNFPMMMRGDGSRTPDRVGVVNVLDRNANSVKRRLARNLSDDLMKPHLNRYYVYLLLYGPENGKGDIRINVSGYSALVEREIQSQEIAAMGSIVLDPRFGVDPKKWMVQYMKSRKLDSEMLFYDDQEWQELVSKWEQIMESANGEDPRITAAKLNAEVRMHGYEVQGAIAHSKNELDRELADLDMQKLAIEAAIERELQENKQKGITADNLDDIKARIATEVMKIRSTHQLVDKKAPADKMPKPPVEPPGRAEAGSSYQQ